MIPHLGPVELTLILVIVIMLFGVGKLPEVFGSVGRGIREFRRNANAGETTPTDHTDAPASSVKTEGTGGATHTS